MATNVEGRIADMSGPEELRRSWGWLVGLGIALLLLGTIAISASVVTTVVSVVLFGWLLIIGGVLEAGHASWREAGWDGFFVNLLAGILHAVVGFMLVANPAAGAMVLALIISLYLMLAGGFRIVVAVASWFHHWGWCVNRGWMLLSGVIQLLLGIAIWRQWPLSGLWVIGLFVGIELALNGLSVLMLGLAAKKIPAETSSPHNA